MGRFGVKGLAWRSCGSFAVRAHADGYDRESVLAIGRPSVAVTSRDSSASVVCNEICRCIQDFSLGSSLERREQAQDPTIGGRHERRGVHKIGLPSHAALPWQNEVMECGAGIAYARFRRQAMAISVVAATLAVALLTAPGAALADTSVGFDDLNIRDRGDQPVPAVADLPRTGHGYASGELPRQGRSWRPAGRDRGLQRTRPRTTRRLRPAQLRPPGPMPARMGNSTTAESHVSVEVQLPIGVPGTAMSPTGYTLCGRGCRQRHGGRQQAAPGPWSAPRSQLLRRRSSQLPNHNRDPGSQLGPRSTTSASAGAAVAGLPGAGATAVGLPEAVGARGAALRPRTSN